MPHVVQTEALVAEGVLTQAQGLEIARRSRDTMLALVVNIVLCAGIIAASLGFVFWIADAVGVALLGLAFLAAGLFTLARAGALYRMLGHAATLIGGGMLIAGAGIEIADKLPDYAHYALLTFGAGIAALSAFAFQKGPQTLRFSLGALGLMGIGLHLSGLLYLITQVTDGGAINVIAALYATALIVAAGVVGTAGVASAHNNEKSGKPFGGPIPTAQGHFNGIDCAAADAGKTPFIALGICSWDG